MLPLELLADRVDDEPLIGRPLACGGKETAPILKVVGNEAARDDVDGRSLLDEIARKPRLIRATGVVTATTVGPAIGPGIKK